MQVDTLIVDREPRIGDNWRKRYHALTLHNQVQVNHLPYMPFPPSWPTYIPKDKLAGWFEAYVESLELNYWPATQFESGVYDEAERRWSVVLRRSDGRTRQMHPRHVVHGDRGERHSEPSRYPEPAQLRRHACCIPANTTTVKHWQGKEAIVIGTGNSGHDIAQDLHSSGAKVTLVQRSPTLIVNIEPSAQLPYTLYDEGPPLEDCDLIADVHAADVGKEEPHPHDRAGARSSTRACSTRWSAWASSSISARTARAGSSNTSPAAAATTSMSVAPI